MGLPYFPEVLMLVLVLIVFIQQRIIEIHWYVRHKYQYNVPYERCVRHEYQYNVPYERCRHRLYGF